MFQIDPKKITDYKRKISELERFIVFSICVAGKNAQRTARAIEIFLNNSDKPFEAIRKMEQRGTLIENLRKAGIGQYTRISKCLKDLVSSDISLETVTVDELELFHGIGPKTSRFFILHSRKNQNLAVLDTHILNYLSRLGYNVPKSTPSKKKYKEIEQIFLKEAEKNKMTPADFDLAIWKLGNNGDLKNGILKI